MIEFQGVTIVYNGRPVMDRVSFTAQFHEKIAILGASGEGKTTILKLIVGLEQPDSGRILVDGTDISSLTEAELRDIRMNFSIVFQKERFDSRTCGIMAFCLGAEKAPGMRNPRSKTCSNG
jgi:phospholipid/cholesterol/gamma-HCH transport system ATP-binding protein